MVSTAAVGGGGGGYQGGPEAGANGGSGGGGAYNGSAAGGTGTAGQGTNGGSGAFAASQYGGGGGGGATSAGSNGTGSAGGNGGAGTASSISGSSVTYAGGGGGGANTANPGSGGAGGGGAGGINSGVGTAGTANTGGGGGGGANSGAANFSGGAGGSGVVIISYPGSTQLMAGGTVTVAGGNVIHTFTSSGFLTPIVLTTNSLRFRSSASAYLNRTATTPTDAKKGTLSMWVKRGLLTLATSPNNGDLVGSGDGFAMVQFYDTSLYFGERGSNGYISTAAVFRDPSAWYHVFCVFDTTLATANDRLQIWVNNVRQATGTFNVAPTLNSSFKFLNENSTVYNLGAENSSSSVRNNFDGYMTEINFVDGQALTPFSFGTTSDLGVWQPIRYGGSYGTNGFYLKFTNNDLPVALGYDSSPNGNNWTPNNFSLARSYTTYTSSSGTYTVPTGVTSIQYLVVGGGGGGGGATSGASNGGSGGGAGGMLYGTMSVTPGQTISYSVGAGGTGGTSSGGAAGAGNNSTFGSLTAVGGGYGIQSGSAATGGSGGSGGGSAGGGTAGSGTSGQGNNGGVGGSSATGGGGGAGAVGGISPSGQVGGAGGAGLTWINGTTYAGGGGGGGYDSAGSGGSGGGGAGGNSGTAGTANTGGGGGGANGNIGASTGGAGGSGIIIIATGSASTYDSMTDVPTLTSVTTANYCTLNPLNLYTGTSCANGNLQGTTVTGAECGIYGTIGMTSGKFYWESTPTSISSGGCMIGIAPATTQGSAGSPGLSVTTGYGYYTTGSKYNGAGAAYGNTFTTSDVIGCALDLDNGKIWWSKNGVFQASGDPAAGTNAAFTSISGTFVPGIGNGGSGSFSTVNVNFGQQPFVYTPPTGFKALNTFNL